MVLTFGEQLKVLLKRKNISVSEVARKINCTPQNLNQRIKKDNFNEKDMKKLCDTLGYDLIIEIREK